MRVLVLTHTFPPSGHTNAKRPAAVVRDFLAAGWEVEVITSSLGVKPGVPETLAHPNLRLVRVADPGDRLCERFAGNFSLYRRVVLARNGLLWPDELSLWCRRVLPRARRTDADRVLAFVFPASMLLAGNYRGLVTDRWVFDYQEPITPHWRVHPRRSPVHRWMFPALCRLERRALAPAGRVIFSAETNRQAYLAEGLVRAEQAAHVPYFFDASAFAPPVAPPPGRFEIAYLGTFDWRGARSPETFLRSLARFLEAHPEARLQTHFRFHGSWLPEHDRFLDELSLRDVVALHPPVPYAEYVRQLQSSFALLLVVSAVHNLFMPSKIADYFGAGRPILAFVPRDSEMRRVLEASGLAGFTADEEDAEAGATAIGRLWARFRIGQDAAPDLRREPWSSHTQLPRYRDLIASAGPR